MVVDRRARDAGYDMETEREMEKEAHLHTRASVHGVQIRVTPFERSFSYVPYTPRLGVTPGLIEADSLQDASQPPLITRYTVIDKQTACTADDVEVRSFSA